MGSEREAWRLHEDALDRCRKSFGADHPTTLFAAVNLVVFRQELGENAQARSLGEDTLTRLRRVLGDDHPNTLVAAHNLILVLRALGEDALAGRLAAEFPGLLEE